MAQAWRHRSAIAAALLGLVALALRPRSPRIKGWTPGRTFTTGRCSPSIRECTRPGIWAQTVDAAGRFAVTGGDDRTARIWSLADGKLLRTIWMPVGRQNVGDVYAVAISPDGSTIAAASWMETIRGESPIYLFDRESGNLIRRISDDLPDVTHFLTFSPDGRYLAATLGSTNGLRVFDRDKDWSESFRDDQYGSDSYGATFARDGRLTTASYDGMVRLYRNDPNNDRPNFRRVGEPVRAAGGNQPYGAAFSPDGQRLAIGYNDAVEVDVLDGTTLKPVGRASPSETNSPIAGMTNVAWSRDGRTLFAAGGVRDRQSRRLIFAWDRNGLGTERHWTYCAPDSVTDIDPLPDGSIFIASLGRCLGLMDALGKTSWIVASPVLDFRDQRDVMRVSQNGQIVDFGFRESGGPVLRFDVRALRLSSPPPNDDRTFAPNREGLAIAGWLNGRSPTLDGRTLPIQKYDVARRLATAPDAERFFLGSNFSLTTFDDTGAQKWRWNSRNEIWAVNASKDWRVVVTADGDGAIRWRRADDGRELLALQVVLPNGREPAKWDWVLWTPEGFYEATPGAQDVLKWVVNHGPDKAATTLIAKLHRPDALKRVLEQLETERALGVADVAAARLDVQQATDSAKPPGGVLQVLAIGVDQFGDKAGGLKLEICR